MEEDLLRAVAELKRRLSSAELQNGVLTADNERLHESAANAVKTLASQSRLIETQREENATQAEMISLLHAKASALERDNHRLRDTAKHVEAQLAEQLRVSSSLDYRVRQLEEAYARLQGESHELLAFATAADADLVQYRHQLAALHSGSLAVRASHQRALERVQACLTDTVTAMEEAHAVVEDLTALAGQEVGAPDAGRPPLPVASQAGVPVGRAAGAEWEAGRAPLQDGGGSGEGGVGDRPPHSSRPATAATAHGDGQRSAGPAGSPTRRVPSEAGASFLSDTQRGVPPRLGADALGHPHSPTDADTALQRILSAGKGSSPQVDTMYAKQAGAPAPVVVPLHSPVVSGQGRGYDVPPPDERAEWDRALREAAAEEAVRASRMRVMPRSAGGGGGPSPSAAVGGGAGRGTAPSRGAAGSGARAVRGVVADGRAGGASRSS